MEGKEKELVELKVEGLQMSTCLAGTMAALLPLTSRSPAVCEQMSLRGLS